MLYTYILHIDAISGSCNLDDSNFPSGFFLVSHLSIATVTRSGHALPPKRYCDCWEVSSLAPLNHTFPCLQVPSALSMEGCTWEVKGLEAKGKGKEWGQVSGENPQGGWTAPGTLNCCLSLHLGKVQWWQELSMREAITCASCEKNKKEKYPSYHQVQLHQGIWTQQHLTHPMNPGSPSPKLLTWANRYSRELASRRGVASGTFFFS